MDRKINQHPVSHVKWIPVEQVQPNDYNPNAVANKEMKLLHTSISHDGLTQPVVTIYDPESKKYIIIDGFHRFFVIKNYKDVYESTGGMVPCVVIDKPINDRMASIVRHNRARGKHSVGGMAHMVFKLLDNGWHDADVCNELGMELEELLRMKHITGFSKLFADYEYKKEWVTKNQLRIKKEYAQSQIKDCPK